MYDIEKRESIPSTSSLSKLGVSAVSYTAAGVFALLLNSMTGTWFGFVLGAIVCLFGFGSFTSKDRSDRKAGFVIMIAGILVFLSRIPFLERIASVPLIISGICLLALGIRNGIKFFLGLRKRS